MGNAYKKLGKNIGLFTISSFGTKILSLILVPLYTNCLTTAEYGTADLLSTIVQLLIPVFTLDIADAVIRYTLEKNTDNESILGIAFKVIMCGAALLCAILFGAGWIFHQSFSFTYVWFLLLSFLFTSIYNSLTNFFRGIDKVTDVVIAGMMSTCLNGICNVIFLLKFKWGITGYLIANLTGVLIPSLFLFIRSFLCGYIKSGSKSKFDLGLCRHMLTYCTPLIINGLSWWINNSLDRLFVTYMCGIDANGLLAVSYKIPSILAMFQTIFNQAWTMSAVQEFDREDKNGFFATTYSLYGCGMAIVCSVTLILNIPLARFLYVKDFFQAWQYTGMLVIAHLFGALSICISGIFSAVKDSKTLALSTLFGAIINTFLNYILINKIGVLGAVIATLVSNVFIWIFRMKKMRDYVSIKINYKRDVSAYIVLLLQCLLGLHNKHFYLGQLICIVVVLFLYRNESTMVIKVSISKMRQFLREK